MRVRHAHARVPCPAPRSGNGLGPDGGRALAAGLERLTALQTLNMRWPWGGGGMVSDGGQGKAKASVLAMLEALLPNAPRAAGCARSLSHPFEVLCTLSLSLSLSLGRWRWGDEGNA